MTKIILQPCRHVLASKHFDDTVKKKVALSAINEFLTEEQRNELAQIYPDGMCHVWGVEPKTKDVNVGKWKRIRPGDIALFARNRNIFCSGTVTMTVHNKDAAYRLWNDNKQGSPSTWEYMYFLNDINPLDIDVQIFNKIKGNKPNANIQGFNVLNEEESQLILGYLGIDAIEGGTFEIPPSDDRLEIRLRNLSQTDNVAEVIVREEHMILTKLLFGRRAECKCAICHNNFPVSLLTTAHIKRRANCSHEERTNRLIVMPLCRFGCDDLYERGYVSVVNKKVVAVRKKPLTDNVRKYLAGIVGNECIYYKDETAAFFEWHHNHHKQKYFVEIRITD